MIVRTGLYRFILILALFLVSAILISPVIAADNISAQVINLSDNTDFDRPVMHFTSEELREYALYQENMPMANAYEGDMLPLANRSLLSAVPYIGKDRDQGYCGNCWVWAPTGALEIAHTINNNVSDRLSVQYFNSNWHNGTAVGNACNGGWSYWVAEFYNSTLQKAIPWSNSNASYADYYYTSGNSSGIPASSISSSPHYPIMTVIDTSLDTSHGQAHAIQNLKAQINADIPVIYSYYLPKDGWTDFYSFWKNQTESDIWNPDPYSGGEIWGGHAVLIVGYDDTGSTPYWTVLNSWGTNDIRPNGLFRLKMDLDYNGTAVENGTPYSANMFEIFNTAFVPPEPAPGDLTVNSKPSQASIWIDDLNTGYQTPMIIKNISSGDHSLKLLKPGYFEYEEPFTISPDQNTRISISLTQIGVLSVSSIPSGAAIWIDGSDSGKTTSATIPLIPGAHKLKLLKSGFTDYSTEFTVQPWISTTLYKELNQTG
ncbi:MAG: hypothetical protein CVV33_00985 [Methanomicrobiales archaeon HGW-Methanomicrobiales-4]|nr:MAG: hypothetical protein CVV33_00985 [Methanomicrobiales archaeon HGW-Methanomicrobiales-4]